MFERTRVRPDPEAPEHESDHADDHAAPVAQRRAVDATGSESDAATAAADIDRLIVQAKLAVGPVDDPLEREADDVAQRVTKSIAQQRHDPAPEPEPATDDGPRAQRQTAPELSDAGDDDSSNRGEASGEGSIVIGRRIQRSPAAPAALTLTPTAPRIQRLRNPFRKKQEPAAPVISGPGRIDSGGQFQETFNARNQEGISAPANVHVRSGAGGIEPLGAIDTSMRENDQDAALGDGNLSMFAREQVSGEAGAPGAHQEFPDAEQLGENDILFPSPSADDISLPTKTELDDDPVGVIKAYTHYAGEFLKFTQRHDVKIERYARYFEADYEAVSMSKVEFEAAEAADDEAKQKELETGVGGNPITEFHYAEWRLERAHQAEHAADKEVPLVDGVYETARDVQKQHGSAGGGKSITSTQARVDQYTQQATDPSASPKKKTKAQKQLADTSNQLVELNAAKEEGGRLGRLVKQAKMSEDLLRVKRAGLKSGKQEVKKGNKRGVSLGEHLKKKGGTAIASAALSAGTLGIVALNQEKVDGGYTTKRRVKWLWPRIKDEFQRIRETWDKRPYGAATSFHLGLEGFSFVVKELRNIFLSAALIALGISLIPGAGAVAGPIAGFCSTVAVGLAALKLVIDVILASWSVIARLTNSNARNSDLLTAQAARQGGDILVDTAAVGMAFGGAAIGNAVAGEELYSNPYERSQNGDFAGTTRDVDYTDGRDIGAAAANVGSRTATGVVAEGAKEAAFVEPIASTSLQNTKMNHMRRGRRDAQHADIDRPAALPVEQDPTWVSQAKGDEAEARRSSLTALVTAHAAKIKRFHAKTQKLMSANRDLAGSAPKMSARAEEAEQQEDSSALVEVAGGFGAAMASAQALAAELPADRILAEVGG